MVLAAPLLLDRNNRKTSDNVKTWLQDVYHTGESIYFQDRSATEGEVTNRIQRQSTSKSSQRCFHDPLFMNLGPIPCDLAEVLADIAIASPAVTASRSVSRYYDSDHYSMALFAFDLASEFFSLFNKPESISAVRLSTGKAPYWRRVLQYCVNGCLQSVLDEFLHVLKADCPTIWKMFDRIVESMNLGTSSIKVDDLRSFLGDKRRNMRCHYAVDLGNQRIETDDGRQRIKGIRYNFNSPFRPFVLATTSIGQEGLDFHTYCRKIVHWNLPSNPIDLEQREGRINRFKGLVIRQQIAAKYGPSLTPALIEGHGLWDALFLLADMQERRGTGKCELIPFWHVNADHYQIERIIPFYPFSKDRAKLSSLLRTLALYRLAFANLGSPN